MGLHAATSPRGANLTEMPAQSPTVWSLTLRSSEETERLAVRLAGFLRAGDLVTLSGDLGVGKSTFARAVVRHFAGDPELEVPSPTFTLMQLYQTAEFPIVHADLYRIHAPAELAELGWDEAADGALVLVEWPERSGGLLPPDRLDIALSIDKDDPGGSRTALITGFGSFADRLAEARGILALLDETGFADAARTLIAGDASTRAYDRLTNPDGKTAILVVSPPRADAPVVRFGKPYYEIAHLARDIQPFLAMAKALRAQGVSAPAVLAERADAGLAVLEDLGAEPFVDENGPIFDRYLEAVGLLAKLHASRLPEVVPQSGTSYAIPRYDLDALLIEAELVIDWYAPYVARVAVPASGRAIFMAVCTRLFEDLLTQQTTWCLRDFHSPNLLWLPDRQGFARVGILDFQDTVLGHPAYDLAALLQDARATVPDSLELKLLGAYAQMRLALDPGFDMPAFVRAYAILGVQRSTKILGIFARLDKRDRKPQYLALLPRIEAYLRKGLAHPAMGELKAWYESYLPRVVAPAP